MSLHRELEVKFLDINKEEIKSKLKNLGAIDLGEDLIEEVIIYDQDLKWKDEGKKFIRLRKRKGKIYLAYKNHFALEFGKTEEIEVEVSDLEIATAFFEELGFIAYRQQEKKRHTFTLNGVTFDIDTWPRIPTYLEIEGTDKMQIKNMAKELELDWSMANFESALEVIEKIYSVAVGKMRHFTFGRFE